MAYGLVVLYVCTNRGVFKFSDGYGGRHIKVEVGFIITPTEKNGTKLHDCRMDNPPQSNYYDFPIKIFGTVRCHLMDAALNKNINVVLTMVIALSFIKFDEYFKRKTYNAHPNNTGTAYKSCDIRSVLFPDKMSRINPPPIALITPIMMANVQLWGVWFQALRAP